MTTQLHSLAALATLAILTFAAAPAPAAVTEAWVQRYSNVGDSVDQASKVLRDAAGDFLVVGATADRFAVQGLLIIKYSGTDGSVVWQKRHDGPAAILINPAPAASVLAAVVDGSGNVVVTTRADGSNGYGDYYTAKYAAADGALLWERRYDGPAHGADIPRAVAVDASGNVVVAGGSQIGNDGIGFGYTYPFDFYTAMYAAADGALLWEKRYDGPANGHDFPSSVEVDAGGNVIVTGASQSGSSEDYYTASYAAADGALLWEKRYNGPANKGDAALAVAMDGSGNAVVTGTSYNGSNDDYYTASYAAGDGALLWEKRFNGPASGTDGLNGPRSLATGPNGIMAITGGSDGDFRQDTTIFDYVTIVYRPVPPPLSFAGWSGSFGLSGAAAAADADPDADGLANGLEYILGRNAAVAAALGGATATSSGGNMLFTFSRDDTSEIPGVSLTVETSADLVTWPAIFTIGPNTEASSPGVNVVENGTAADTISVTISQGTATRLLARLKVTIAP